MKFLALTLPGNQTLQLPGEIQRINEGSLGSNIIRVTINGLLIVATILCIFFLIYGGIKIITSQGDPKNIQNGRSTIIYASVGLAVAFLAYMFVNIFCHFIGVKCL